MGNSSERCLDASDDNRNIRIYLLQDLSIDGNRIIRPLPCFSFRSICVVASQTLGGGIMVHHRIHGTAVHSEVQTRRSELAEITQVVAPVRLRHYGYPVAVLLQPAGDHSSTEGRMVDECIAGKQDHIYVIPSQGLDLLDRGRYHVCSCFLHIIRIVQI